jgi:phosphatidylserine/phosphatidylglycerophosphate/cardiolipin synthase-like enzyme
VVRRQQQRRGRPVRPPQGARDQRPLVQQQGTKVVYTGSQNYTEEGNRVNDELIVRIRDNSTYTRYVKNLNYVRDHGTKGRITTVPARIDGRAAARLLQQDQADQGRLVEKEAGPDIPMIDDDGFQRPLGGDVDFDG